VWRKSGGCFGRGEWVSCPSVRSEVCSLAADETMIVQLQQSGKVSVVTAKAEAMVLPTVRVASFSFFSGSGVMALQVVNSKHRVFASLYPEPLLRVATVRGLVKWLVSTGCKFPSDVAAVQFALPTLLKLQHGGIPGFVRLIGKYAFDATSKTGARKLLETLLESPSTRPQDARVALAGAQSFLGEVELAALWQLENQRSANVEKAALLSRSEKSGGSSLELDEATAFSPKQIAAALTALRARQYAALAPADIVGFAMISPDPMSFELYADVAEFVDFGNTLGRQVEKKKKKNLRFCILTQRVKMGQRVHRPCKFSCRSRCSHSLDLSGAGGVGCVAQLRSVLSSEWCSFVGAAA
jgi:hypothetical protein